MPSPSAQVYRDPYARTTLMRTSTNSGPGGCAYCGQTRKGRRLFHYYVESDDGRTSHDSRDFCSLACRRDFYDLGSRGVAR